MRTMGYLVAGAMLLAPAFVSAAEPLSGNWQVGGVTIGGEGPKMLKSKDLTVLHLVFGKDIVTLQEKDVLTGKTTPRARLKFSADAKAKPKTIDVEVLDGPDKGAKYKGTWTYSEDEGLLKLFLTTGPKRPDPKSRVITEGLIQLELIRLVR